MDTRIARAGIARLRCQNYLRAASHARRDARARQRASKLLPCGEHCLLLSPLSLLSVAEATTGGAQCGADDDDCEGVPAAIAISMGSEIVITP